MLGRSVVVSLLIITAVGGVALTPYWAQAAAANPRLERELMALTNVDRTSNGRTALLEQDQLIGLARERSDDMITRDYFAHEIPPTGERVFAVNRFEFAERVVAGSQSPRGD